MNVLETGRKMAIISQIVPIFELLEASFFGEIRKDRSKPYTDYTEDGAGNLSIFCRFNSQDFVDDNAHLNTAFSDFEAHIKKFMHVAYADGEWNYQKSIRILLPINDSAPATAQAALRVRYIDVLQAPLLKAFKEAGTFLGTRVADTKDQDEMLAFAISRALEQLPMRQGFPKKLASVMRALGLK